MKTNRPKVVGKIIFRADVINTTPMLISSGNEEEYDFEVIRDKNGNPYIPASGFGGMLRDRFEGIQFDNDQQIAFDYFFGSKNTTVENSFQSHIIIDDLKIKQGTNYKICVRDGVEINLKTGTAEEHGKYDYELIEPNAKFSLNMELTIRECIKNKESLKDILYFIAHCGTNELYQQGAFKSNNFGVIKFENIEFIEFNYTKDADKWFNFLENCSIKNSYDQTKKIKFQIQKNVLNITGIFKIKNSLIIRSKDIPLTENKDSHLDYTHLTDSKGNPLLTAKSIRGPIRHRANKILKHLNYNNSEKFLNELFGFVDKKKKEAKKGKLKTSETIVQNVEKDQIQTRIQIDYFTGGTIQSALIQSKPLWHKSEYIELKFQISNCKKEQAGLFLLLMKDLMHEDLPIGGEKSIGKGALIGQSLTFEGKIDNEEIKLEFDKDGLKEEYKDKISEINTWVNDFCNNNNLKYE
jgi:CRISPR/Cas system CSM-associated protein Csm3 (group 7 of RAMP superfamily)